MILAGDGSGGHASKDFCTRRCGFGLAIIKPVIGEGFLYSEAQCPEATALLFALLTTSGNATYICDNLGVVQRFDNSGKSNIKGRNGLAA